MTLFCVGALQRVIAVAVVLCELHIGVQCRDVETLSDDELRQAVSSTELILAYLGVGVTSYNTVALIWSQYLPLPAPLSFHSENRTVTPVFLIFVVVYVGLSRNSNGGGGGVQAYRLNYSCRSKCIE